MIRTFKVLGLALVAVLAVSAMAASAASAAEFHATKSTHTVFDVSAKNTQVFKAAGNEVKCSTVTAEGTLSTETVTQVTVTPEYTGCVAVVGGSELTARVTFTGCGYLFTNDKTADGKHYRVHVECETSPGVKDEIHIEVFAIGKFRPCYTIPQQTPTSGGVIYTETANHIDVKATVGGIEYTKEAGSCGPAGTANDATYDGEVTVKGTDTAGKEIDLDFS